MNQALPKVAVLGAGSWGTALAIQLAKNPLQVCLWGHLREDVEKLINANENTDFLPGIPFPENLKPSHDLQGCLQDADEILLAVPSHAVASMLQQIKPLMGQRTSISWATKGLDPHNNKLISEQVSNTLGNISMAALSGPTFAREVAEGLPTAIVIASPDDAHAEIMASYLKNEHFRPYTSNDLIGVQVGGAAKNIMAIAAGISDGLGFGANSRAALITRGLAEITRLGIKLGGHPETFMGLAGLGDLVLTCTDNQSRNRRFGLALAQGKTEQQAREEIGQEVEGISTAREIFKLAQQLQVEMPITEQTYKVLYDGLDPTTAVHTLLNRQTRAEND